MCQSYENKSEVEQRTTIIPERTYRVAIVGLGRMGSTIDDEFPDDRPPYSVAAACDAGKRSNFTERWGVAAVYNDYVEMIRQENPDMVAICTQGHLHAEMAVRVAEERIRLIFCEKAIACSVDEADAVLEAVISRNALFPGSGCKPPAGAAYQPATRKPFLVYFSSIV